MKWFNNINTLDELKEVYRTLCKIHHPDKGGDTKTMQDINAEYEKFLLSGNVDLGVSSFEIEEAIRSIIEKTDHLTGLNVELCGRWVWFSGDTFHWKKTLKELGCKFAPKKKMWFWKPEDAKIYRHEREIPIDEIRAKYGSQVFSKEQIVLAS